jgi:flavin reductase (DIM6/NTAB) family NADH-FMN oxidoreductase RutF
MEIDVEQMNGQERYRLLVASIIPRPIAFVSTIDSAGATNLAPFSYFNVVTSRPALISISIGQRVWQGRRTKKDTLQNIEQTGEFVVNLAVESMLEAVNDSSADYAPGVSELEELGLTAVPSLKVKPPRIKESPVHLECKLSQVLMLGEHPQVGLVIGQVVQYHAEAGVLEAASQLPDPERLRPLARLGGSGYAGLGELFSRARPADPRGPTER